MAMQGSKQYNADLLPSNGKFFRKGFTDSIAFTNETRGIFFPCSKSFVSSWYLGKRNTIQEVQSCQQVPRIKKKAQFLSFCSNFESEKTLCTRHKTNVKYSCKDNSIYPPRCPLPHFTCTVLGHFTEMTST